MLSETHLKEEDIRIGRYNKDIYREYEGCYEVFNIEKAFKENAFICNGCYKLLEREDIKQIISPKIFICRIENQMYRVCSKWIDIL